MTDTEKLELGAERARGLGLNTRFVLNAYSRANRYYLADDIHELLGESREVFGKDGAKANEGRDKWYWSKNEDLREYDTHKGLLIGIRAIVQESPERALLRELVALHVNGGNLLAFQQIDELGRRARKLLSEGEK